MQNKSEVLDDMLRADAAIKEAREHMKKFVSVLRSEGARSYTEEVPIDDYVGTMKRHVR